MQLGKLSRELRDAYGDSDVRRRVQTFEGWIDRAALAAAGAGGYDHAKTV
ncbi:MAG: hypothetical protein OXE43_13150 [Chloroflexi bacterium]|nr:hypothetical protein [Chloroflexota bacterium]